MSDHEALHLLWLAPVVMLVVPVAALIYAGLWLARYDDKEVYLHG